MQPEHFDYDLPAELIAQHPTQDRTSSRLLHVAADDGPFEDLAFRQIGELLRPGDLLVLNDTRVLPARLPGKKETGGRIELLLERVLDRSRALVQLRSSHAPAIGSALIFASDVRARVLAREQQFYVLEFDAPVESFLTRHGHVPLPPYIRRADEPADRERYQTVYASVPGAVAAPTAGLHFDRPLLDRLAGNGVGIGMLTLHVAAGTFQPLRDEQLSSGRLHPERVEVAAALCEKVEAARRSGGRVVAVGTTTVRALESAARSGRLRPLQGETDIFIKAGFEFRAVDALITNFHLPRSSLLMLVCAFAGRERVLGAYRHAVASGYRFYSYGDAMFLQRATGGAPR